MVNVGGRLENIMPKYLLKQRQGWYAVLEIPKSLRPYFGKVRFKETLHTDSLRIAQSRVLPIIVEWKSWIAAVRSGDSTFDVEVKRWQAERERLRQSNAPEHEIEEGLFAIAVDSESPDQGIEFLNVSSGKWIRLSDHIDEYINTLDGINVDKTIDMKRSDISRFTNQFTYAHETTKRDVIDWVENTLIAKEGLSAPTCSRIMSSVNGYWDFLERHKGLNTAAPLQGVVPKRRVAQRNAGVKQISRTHFTPNDFNKLLKQCRNDEQLNTLIWLGAYKGCRIEELCSLKLEHVLADRFLIHDAKTEAGNRIVPIHDDIKGLVKGLKGHSNDGYLLNGLTFNKYGDRSNAIGKRFGRLKVRCGFGPDLVFYSFRKGVATQLETAGVPENVTARLLGHDFHTMSYGVYSGGVSFEVLLGALKNLNWC